MRHYSKVHKTLAEHHQSIDAQLLDSTHRFVNMAYDAYVHGAYESRWPLAVRKT